MKTKGKSGKRIFNGVPTSIWRTPKFRALTLSERAVLLYFVTGPHVDSTGCSSLPAYVAAPDLNISEEEYAAALAAVEAAGFIASDPETEEVYVLGWFRIPSNTPDHKNHVKGTASRIAEIESDRLREVVEQELMDTEKGAENLAKLQEPSPSMGADSRLLTTPLMKRAGNSLTDWSRG